MEFPPVIDAILREISGNPPVYLDGNIYICAYCGKIFNPKGSAFISSKHHESCCWAKLRREIVVRSENQNVESVYEGSIKIGEDKIHIIREKAHGFLLGYDDRVIHPLGTTMEVIPSPLSDEIMIIVPSEIAGCDDEED